jgi:hypothetical protein
MHIDTALSAAKTSQRGCANAFVLCSTPPHFAYFAPSFSVLRRHGAHKINRTPTDGWQGASKATGQHRELPLFSVSRAASFPCELAMKAARKSAPTGGVKKPHRYR